MVTYDLKVAQLCRVIHLGARNAVRNGRWIPAWQPHAFHKPQNCMRCCALTTREDSEAYGASQIQVGAIGESWKVMIAHLVELV